MLLRHRLQPYALPDAGYRSVPHSPVIYFLLAPRILVIQAVAGFDYQAVNSACICVFFRIIFLLCVQKVCYVKAERQIAALMGSCILSVDVYPGNLIYCTKVNDKPLTVPFIRHFKLCPVKHYLIGFNASVYTGEPAFRTKRDSYRALI